MLAVPAGCSLVLASASPRRRALLLQAGLDVAVRPADIDETPRPGESAGAYVRRLSIDKAAAGGATQGTARGTAQGVTQGTARGAIEVIIAADTTVECDGEIFEKPRDDADAATMLRRLSGRTHRVHTGVTVAAPTATQCVARTAVITTEVTFVELTDEMIAWYLSTGEANDKAGAYGIQGAAAGFVERVDGSVTNVIGLPVAEAVAMLADVFASLAD